MNDTQLYIAIGIPILFNVTILTVINAALGKRIDDMRDVLRAEAIALRAETKTDLLDIRNRIERMDDNVARVLADHDRRLSKLESK